MSFTLEAVKEKFCTMDKLATLKQIREQLDDVWDIDEAAKLTAQIGEQMEKGIEAAGSTWTPEERILWAVKEAFIIGSLDMAMKMMTVNDMGYEALAEESSGMKSRGD